MECRVEGINIYFETIGDGKPIFMLHGRPYDHTHMLFEMERHFTLRAGWQRIYFDLPGMGRTPSADWMSSSDDMLYVVEQFIERVAPKQRFLLAGLSYGGYLARGLVYRRGAEIDGVLLSVPSVSYPAEDLPQRRKVVIDPRIAAQAQAENITWFEEEAVSENIGSLEYARIINKMQHGDTNFLDKLRMKRSFSFDVDALSQPFEAPSLFILGRQDCSVGYRHQWQILENYPRATFAILDGAGHMVWGEKTALCEVLVNDWLDRVDEWLEGDRQNT